MAKNLLLYDKYNKVINTTMDVKGTTGYITIENLIPDTDYPEGEFYVGWEVEGKILPKATVPEFTTLRQMREKLVIVYFSDLTEKQLVDIKGDSAYKVALDNGFNGTQKEWLESLKGEPGEQGRQGDPGRDGVDITEGGSAYEIALAEGFQGTREEWLESLKGEPGKQGEKGDPGEDGFGVDGASAYEIALENGFIGNIQDFLDSLVGEPGRDGQDGNDGLSVYEIALENGFQGTEEEWLESLKIGVKDAKDYTDSRIDSIDDNYNNIKVVKDLPLQFEGYSNELVKNNVSWYYPQGIFYDGTFYYISYGSQGNNAKGILVIYDSDFNTVSKYYLGNQYVESLYIEHQGDNTYLYCQINKGSISKIDISGFSSLPNTDTKDISVIKEFSIGLLYRFAKTDNGWIVELDNQSKGVYQQQDTLAIYDNEFTKIEKVIRIPSSMGGELESKSIKRQGLAYNKGKIFTINGGLANVSTGTLTDHELQGILEIGYDGIIKNNYVYSPYEFYDYIYSTKSNIKRIEHEGGCYLNGSIISMICYRGAEDSQSDNSGLLIVQYGSKDKDITLNVQPYSDKSLYNPYNLTVNGKVINEFTGDYITDIKGLVKYLNFTHQNKMVVYSSRAEIYDYENNRIPNGLTVTIENLNNFTFFISYKGNGIDEFYIISYNKDTDTFTKTETNKDRIVSNLDLLSLTGNIKIYATNCVNNPSNTSKYGYVNLRTNGDVRVLRYQPYNEYKEYVNIYSGGKWLGWKVSGVDATDIVAQKHPFTQDNGDRIRISDVDPVTLSTGYYQIWRMKNSPLGFDDNSQYWNVDIITAQDNVKQIRATLSATGQEYTRTIHKGNDLGWKFINNEKYGRNDFKLYTIPLMAPFNTANLSVMENNHIVTVRLQGKANSNTNNISDLDVVIGKLPAHIEYPKDFVRCTISSMSKGETEQFIGNLVIDTKGVITVKFNRSGTSNSYFGGSLSFPKGDNKNVAFNSTNTKVYDYPDPNVVSVQGSDYYDGYIFGAITRTKGNVTEIQVIDTNNTSSSFICTNQQENFSTLVGHGNSLKVVDKINDEYLMYITMTDDPKIVPVFVNTTTKIARVGEGIKTMQDSGGSEKRIISIDRVDKVGSTYELYCLWYGIEFKYTISNINTVESLRGEQVFKLPLERVIEDKKMLLNDDSNSIKVYQDNLLDGDTFYITQYGENSSAILEYRVENAMAKSTGKYWYNYRTDAERYEIESIFKINGELYASISQKLFNKSMYDTYVIKVTLNT